MRFRHFKNLHEYEVRDTGIHAETEEATLSYFRVDARETVYFSSTRRFVEDTNRDGVPNQPRFLPLDVEAATWRSDWRKKLDVTTEQRKN